MKSKFRKIMLFWEIYYPIILAFFSFLYSVSLWFILAASVAIRQRRPRTPYFPSSTNKRRKK